jgi:hypothetical protein
MRHNDQITGAEGVQWICLLGHARMKHLQEVNRRPLKDKLFLQGLSRGNLASVESPHSHTSFFAIFVQKR